MKTCIRFYLILAIVGAKISLLVGQNISSLYPVERSKIDPALQQAVIQKEKLPARPITSVESYAAGKRLSTDYGDVVAVLIRSDEDIANYTKSVDGLKIGSKHGNIYTALVPVRSITKLAQQNRVRYIEASHWLYPSLDLSRLKTGADVLQSLPDSTRRLTGKGIIIGFTDTGINTDHPNFKLPDGRTRILYVWDQYGTGTPPAGFSYGVEKDSSAINAHTWSMSDPYQHGTHTSGIAAGNGKPSLQYIGMAPEADIIMVANQGDDLFNRGLTTVGTLDGYDYIRTKANALHKRFVINTSQGTNLGPHDGTSLFEQAVNADVAAGNIHCISAGNEATSSRHASAVITTPSPQVVQCALNNGIGSSLPMDIWYEANDRLELRIKESADADYLSFFPPVDSTITYSLTSVNLTVTTKIGSPLNGDNEIYIVFQQKTSSCNLQLQFSAQAGNSLPDGGRVDLWWERNYYVTFTDHVDQSITLGMPACADSAITVASYNNRTGYGAVDDISSFSGQGPRRDGVMKPDISGIGGMVISSVGSSGYTTMSGTSMSSPHVAGAVALLLQQDTTLTNYQIKQKLFSSATADGFTGPVPNPIWGSGKLNVLKAAGYHGIPIISIPKDTVYFPNVFISVKTTDSVLINNLGNEDLTISNVSVSDPIFSVDRTSFVVPPRSQSRLHVSVTPVSVGDFSGSITLASNDSINPVSIIRIVGYADYTPAITAVPDSFSVTILEGDSTTRTLRIGNTGQGRLLWNISYDAIIQKAQISKVMLQLNASVKNSPAVLLSKEEANGIDITDSKIFSAGSHLQNSDLNDNNQGSRPAISGALDAYIAEGAVEDFEGASAWPWAPWVNVGGGGTIVNDAYQGANAILNPGWYYRTDVTIGAPGDKMSMWVKPGDGRFYFGFGATSSGAWSLVAGANTNTLILQQNSVYDFLDLASVPQSWVSGTWYRLEVAFLNGGVVEGRLYASDGTTLLNKVSAAMTGFEPAGLAIRGFSNTGGFTGDYITTDLSGKWLSTIPSGGIINSDDLQDVTVKFNASGVRGGDYRSNIVINNNDPLHNPKIIPASLHVIGKPIIKVAPDTLNYGIAFIGIARTDTIVIKNTGSGTLHISDISVSDTAFHLNLDSLTLLFDSSKCLLVSYLPASVGPFSATISISSDDSSALLKTVPIIGEAAFPPVISVVPDSFAVTLAAGDSTIQTMTIGNTGSFPLTWNAQCGVSSSLLYKKNQGYSSYEQSSIGTRAGGSEKTIPGTETDVRSVLSGPIYRNSARPNAAAGISENVLIIGDGGTEYSIDSLLSDAGISSTIVAGDDIYNGTNPSPNGFSTVILCDGFSGWSVGMPVNGQTALVDFVKAGGTLIVMEWVAYEISYGRYTILEPYIPISRTEGNSGLEICTVTAWGPITQNVDSVFQVMTATNVGTARFGSVLVHGSIGGDVVAVNDVVAGKIVQFACAGNYNGMHPFSEPNMRKLLLNSLSLSSLATLTPSSGTIDPGSYQAVDVKFNARNLLGGDYRQIISITSNDPVNGKKDVPANMHVVGKPSISAVPDTVKSGFVYIGTNHTDTIRIMNTGTDVLNVTGISSNIPVYNPGITSFSVLPGRMQIVGINFSPTDSVDYNGILTIASNDSLHPSLNIVLQGRGIYPPAMNIVPDSLSVTVSEEDSTTRIITITNNGESALNWNGSIHYGSAPSNPLLYNDAYNTAEGRLISNNNNFTTAAGGLKTAQTPTLNMMNLSSDPVTLAGTYSGTYLSFGISDYGEIMPFQYPLGSEHLLVGWYGSGYTLAYIANGVDHVVYAGYGSRSGIVPFSYTEIINNANEAVVEITTRTNDSCLSVIRLVTFDKKDKYLVISTTLRNLTGNILQNVVFKEWADWDVDGITYNDWYYNTSHNFTYASRVHYVAIGGQLAPTLMDINGWNDYNIRATSVEYAGGVTNYDGLEILHYEVGDLTAGVSTNITNAYAAGDNLTELQNVMERAYLFSGWLSLDQVSGTVPPHSSVEINARFNSKGIKPGDYSAYIRFSGNDPVHACKDVAARMHVFGKPVISVLPDTIRAGIVSIGTTHVDTLRIGNSGSDVLNVTNIASDLSVYSANITGCSIPADGQQAVAVSFTPTDTIAYNGTLTITSNDSLHPTIQVALRGKGVYPPSISLFADSLQVGLAAGDSTSRIIKIANTGFSDLVWTGIIDFSDTAFVLSSSPVFYSAPLQAKDENIGFVDKRPDGKDPCIYIQTNQSAADNGPELPGNSAAPPALESVLANLNSFYPHITGVIPNRYNFSEGITGTNITDGGDDIYDGGNSLFTGLGGPLAYSNKTIINSPVLGIGGRYFTCKYDGLFVFAADARDCSYFEIDGNLGSDGSGSADGAVLSIVLHGTRYYGFVKRVYNAGDPSVNHMIIVAGNPSLSQAFSTNTNDGFQRVMGLGGITRIYYLLYAGTGGYYIDNTAALNIMNQFLNSAEAAGNWLSISPVSGIVVPGDTVEVNVKFRSAGLISGIYKASINIANNDPVNGSIRLPAYLAVGGTDVTDYTSGIPKVYTMRQNYPNPFNPSTMIQYDLPKPSHVAISIYNILGELVTKLVDEDRPAGAYTVQWNCRTDRSTAASGIYFAVMQAGDYRKTIKMILMK